MSQFTLYCVTAEQMSAAASNTPGFAVPKLPKSKVDDKKLAIGNYLTDRPGAAEALKVAKVTPLTTMCDKLPPLADLPPLDFREGLDDTLFRTLLPTPMVASSSSGESAPPRLAQGVLQDVTVSKKRKKHKSEGGVKKEKKRRKKA